MCEQLRLVVGPAAEGGDVTFATPTLGPLPSRQPFEQASQVFLAAIASGVDVHPSLLLFWGLTDGAS